MEDDDGDFFNDHSLVSVESLLTFRLIGTPLILSLNFMVRLERQIKDTFYLSRMISYQG